MNEFVTAANHWIKKEKGIRRMLVDLGQEDEGSDDDNEEGEDDEDEDLPPPDIDTRTGKRLRY
jgi:hypothetical protein